MLIATILASASAQQSPQPVPVKPAAPAATQPAPDAATASQTPPATPVPPPSAPAKRTAAELQKLVQPIALYPDPLLATLLPASVYPLEVVQAARLMSDPKTASTLDQQPWDDTVKAIAKIPDALKQLNDNLTWTIQLGEAFLAQDKDLMDAIQAMRTKAQKAGTLKTNDQMVVAVTNTVTQTVIEREVVVVTNTVVQIQSSSPDVVYVPHYDPYYVYYPPPSYVYDPYAPLVTFTAGVAMGAIIANNCDWWHGGCYHGDIDVDIDHNVNRNVDRSKSGSASGRTQKWQPDQARLNKSGAPSTASKEARGWSGATSGARPSTGTTGSRPSTATAGPRPSTGAASTARPSPSPTGGARPSPTPSVTRPTPSTSVAKPSPSPSINRPSPTPTKPSMPQAPKMTNSGSLNSSQNNAFSGLNSGQNAYNNSSRGSSSLNSSRSSSAGSRSSGGASRSSGGGASRSSGGGGRGGGGRR
jgi:uncharacterized membrane protein YgcG